MKNQTIWKAGNGYYIYVDGANGYYTDVTNEVNNYIKNNKSSYASGGRKG